MSCGKMKIQVWGRYSDGRLQYKWSSKNLLNKFVEIKILLLFIYQTLIKLSYNVLCSLEFILQ